MERDTRSGTDHGMGAVDRRGSLRILLGAAPGVGKTYLMLREAHRLVAEGHDVVIGVIVTHGRVETEAQIGDLEIVPLRRIEHHGIAIEEMDTEAIIDRHPGIVLVDELAHTNAPGSLREKRWQDVEAMRDAGIDVFATLNIQHIDSLKDVVNDLTGVDVRETVPDRVVAEATEVHLVDLPVEALLERIDQGKVYPPDVARRARELFFQPGHLTALREMALRRTAEGLDDRLAEMMLAAPAPGPATIVSPTERIIVLLDEDPKWGDVLRGAWRLASAMRVELVVLTISPYGSLSAFAADRVERIRHAQELAIDLGARLETGSTPDEEMTIDDRVTALVGAIAAFRATIVVLGIAPQVRRRLLGRDPEWSRMVAAIMASAPEVDLHLISMN